MQRAREDSSHSKQLGCLKGETWSTTHDLDRRPPTRQSFYWVVSVAFLPVLKQERSPAPHLLCNELPVVLPEQRGAPGPLLQREGEEVGDALHGGAGGRGIREEEAQVQREHGLAREGEGGRAQGEEKRRGVIQHETREV